MARALRVNPTDLGGSVEVELEVRFGLVGRVRLALAILLFRLGAVLAGWGLSIAWRPRGS